ncbi:MLO-like protein 12 [Elaeis guineensis]|uniref:MLO-like protein n=1 Tax=Elaeis guineensis var. tenera TaxID=51953 RepID=A0A6J0PFW6_ELAGV|nr:MLO-like protein 12 [Elaeis guineensis]
MMALEASLESTPTWAVAGVCSVLIFIALLIEHALHLLTSVVRRRKRKTLDQAIYQIKAELRNLGFMSLLLTVAKQPISKICILRSLGDSLLPCKNAPTTSGLALEEMDSCEKEGKVPLLSAEATQQLQVLIFVMAVFHVLCCLLTLGLGEAKMKRWESWEEETQTLEHQLSHDRRRFKLARQTSFGKRHLNFWSNHRLLLWLACFRRQFTDSVSKADYFALREGFLRLHLTQNCNFDFHKFLQRSLDQDFVTAIRISNWVWAYVILIIFFSAHGFYNHYWLPLIPLVMLLGIGTKLEVIITRMCLEGKEATVVPGTVGVEPKNDLFWFGKPQLLLHLIQFILVQNSFQLAFFTWTWYKFGLRSCFHKETEDIILSFGIGIMVQFLCAYVTLPLYALVAQMGSSMRKTIFTDRVVQGLRNWHELAKKNLSMKTSMPSSSTLQRLPCPRAAILSSDARISGVSRFEYPSGRRELLEIQRVAEEMIECRVNNVPYDGEISFRLWRKQEVISPQRERH